jgi:hypothetical protein
MASKQLDLLQLRIHPLDEFIDLVWLAAVFAARGVNYR